MRCKITASFRATATLALRSPLRLATRMPQAYLPLQPGSRVLVGLSGAAENGSPLSGGYAGAKRMLWFMAKYANSVSEQKELGIRFQAIVPMQMIGGTGVG